MGLDMYAFVRKGGKESEINKLSVDFQTEDTDEEFFYWRKHPNLHGWMKSLYIRKGGSNEEFNCNSVRLTLEDLEQLELSVLGKGLPETSGFFFGGSSGGQDEVNNDLDFVRQARELLNQGYMVYYTSWW